MFHITALMEAEVRTELGSDISSVDTSGAVFSDVQKFETKKEFYTVLKQRGFDAANPYVRFVQILLVDAQKKDGSYFLIYRINVFHEYFPAGTNTPGSTSIFNALIINLKNKFESAIDLTAYAEVTAAIDGGIKLNSENEFYKGLYGHHVNYLAVVEIGDC